MTEVAGTSIISERVEEPSVKPPPQLQAVMENGFVVLPGGEWLVAPSQPAACKGTSSIKGLGGWIVQDRAFMRNLVTAGTCWLSEEQRPFLARLDAMPDKALHVISSKFLAAPRESRSGAGALRVIPLNFRGSIPYTEFTGGWAIVATKSRATRIVLDDGETLSVKPESLVAWFGQKPTGFCPKLSLLDMLLPRKVTNLTFSFYGPAVVWIEGAQAQVQQRIRKIVF